MNKHILRTVITSVKSAFAQKAPSRFYTKLLLTYLLSICLTFLGEGWNGVHAQIYQNLHDFDGTTGAYPYGSLTSDGTWMYGMTQSGGIYGSGNIFKIKPDGTSFTDLLDFDYSNNGAYPYGDVITDGTWLYGMTQSGGANGSGTVFKVQTDGTNYTKLLDFDGNNGANPLGNLLLDGAWLYGMTQYGGSNGDGVIFKIDTVDGTGYTDLLDFDGTNGNDPYGSVTVNGGWLYGMTLYGGAYSVGNIFKIKTDGTSFTTLLDFDGSNGSYPYGNLLLDGPWIYGMTQSGGSTGQGLIFKIDTVDGSGYSSVFDFDNTNGSYPTGSLITDGTWLYGMAQSGGSSGAGTAFKVKNNGSSFSKLFDFDGNNGGYPFGNLLLGECSTLYGMCQSGGSNGQGLVFKLIPATKDVVLACNSNSYTWIDGNTYSANNDTSIYTIVGGASNGCDSIIALDLKFITKPGVHIDTTGSTFVCSGSDSVTLTASVSNIRNKFTFAAGSTGTDVPCNCPPGYVATGYQGRSGGWLDQFSLVCRQLLPGNTLGNTTVVTSSNGVSGGGGPDGPFEFTGDTVLVGLIVHKLQNNYLDGVQAIGQPLSVVLAGGDNAANPLYLPIVGNTSSPNLIDTLLLDNGSYLTGMISWSNNNYASAVGLNNYGQNTYVAPINFSGTASYLWNTGATTPSITAAVAGKYYATVTISSLCESLSDTITVTGRTVTNTAVTINEGDTYNFNGHSYAIAGTYQDTIQSVIGCDSVIITQLTVNALGAALHFDGVNDQVDIGNILGTNTSYTKEAWIFSTNNTNSRNIVSSQNNVFFIDNGTLYAGNNGNYLYLSSPALPDSQWVHVAVTYNAVTSTMKLYVNGTLADAGTNADTYVPENMFIGSHAGLSVFEGYMDEVRIWNRALCESEIQNNMNGELPMPQTGLVAYYKFNQGVAGADNTAITALADSSGNGNDGILDNFALNGMVSNFTAPGALVSGVYASGFVFDTGTDVQSACVTYTWIDGNTYTSSNNTATYTLTNTNGCDSLVTLNLTINHSNTGTDVQSACDTYTWIDGNTYTSSNNTATYTLTNTNGCDSLVTLNLTINHSNTGTDVQTACDSYTWIDGNTYTSSNNTATYTLTNTNGCDSLVTLNLTINHSNTGTDVQSACDTYTWIDGNTYTSDNNTATYTLTNVSGCDSVVTLNLTINHSNTGTDVQTACDSYTWIDGNTYTSDNNSATYTLTNVNGCDSVVTLNLTINHSNTGTDVQTACDSYTWIDGNTYTSDNNSATYTLTNVSGCDSVVTLNLTINHSNTGTDVQTACDSYTWIDGNTYTSDNNSATYTLTNVNGCDSVVTLNLTINHSNTGTDVQSACDTYTWIDGNTYTSSDNTATYTLTNTNGCDSLVTLNLTINHSNTGTDVQSACDTYTWIDGNTYTSSNNTATYTLTNVSGCDSVVTLNLTINHSNTGTDVQSACDTYTWIDGNTYTSSDNTATYTLTNTNGCDSLVTLNLTINHSNTGTDVQSACDTYTWIDGNTYTSSNNTATYTLTNVSGCDSVVTLNLTINHSNTGTDVQSACDTYTWIDGNTYTSSDNTATYTLTNTNGCDSLVTLNLTINHSNTGTDVQSACDTYTWIDGNTYTSSNNTATYTLTNTNGCDSLVTLNLTINHSNTGTDVQSACDTYTWIDGNTYTSSNNTATYTLTNVSGCDSVVTLNLTINHSNTGTDVQSACDTYTWIDGNTYTSSNNTATYTLTNTNGCDSLVTLNLTINHSNTGTDVQTACDSYTWIDGNTYTSSNNTATYTLTNTNGCDSLVTLNLTINHSNTGTDVQSACDTYTWIDGNTYTSDNNTATYTLTNVNGCDSVVTLNLTINHSNTGTDVQTACDSYTWIDGNTYTSDNNTATYTLTNVSGCDSVVTLNLTVTTIDTAASVSNNVCTANQTGAGYQWLNCATDQPVNGATSQIYTALQSGSYRCVVTLGNCVDTTTCLSIIGANITPVTDYYFEVFPNPNSGSFTIKHNVIGTVSVKLINMLGELLLEHTLHSSTEYFDISDLAQGIYQAVIFNNKGTLTTLRVVKQ